MPNISHLIDLETRQPKCVAVQDTKPKSLDKN